MIFFDQFNCQQQKTQLLSGKEIWFLKETPQNRKTNRENYF